MVQVGLKGGKEKPVLSSVGGKLCSPVCLGNAVTQQSCTHGGSSQSAGSVRELHTKPHIVG